MNRQFIPININGHDPVELPLLKKYHVDVVPTLYILAPDDKEVDRLVDLTDMKLEHYLRFLNQSAEGKETYRAMVEAFDRSSEDVDLAYNLLRKNVQRGDVKGMLAMGRFLLDRPNELIGKPSLHPEKRRRQSMEEDVVYEIRVGLNRSPKEIVLSNIHRFPEIRFSERLYRFTARHLLNEAPSSQGHAFFQIATQHYPNSRSLKKYAFSYAVYSHSNLEEAEAVALQLLETNHDPEIFRELARLLIVQKRVDEALTWYGPSYIQTQMTQPKVLHDYAVFWLSQNLNLNDALAAAETSVLIWRKHSFFYTLAKLHMRLSMTNKAIEAIQTAIRLSDGRIPDYHSLHNLLKSKGAMDQ